MDQQTAEYILYGITAVAVFIWVIGLNFVAKSRRHTTFPSQDRWQDPETVPPNLIHGTTQVEGRPEEWIAKTASLIAQGKVPNTGLLVVLETTANRIVFRGHPGSATIGDVAPAYAGGYTVMRPSYGSLIERGEFLFTPLNERQTQIDYAVSVKGSSRMLWTAYGIQLLGFAAIVAGFVLIKCFIVPSPSPAVRAQAFQMIQCFHFLWPPFLFAGLYRGRFSATRTGFKIFVSNLPYMN